jgi:hypothetical protein
VRRRYEGVSGVSDFSIREVWLKVVQNSSLFYPAAGSDYSEPLAVFQNHIDSFLFCDINYQSGLNLPPALLAKDNFRIFQQEKSGATTAAMERRKSENGRCYNFLQPSKLVETYERSDGRRLVVIRRRGFGQIALSQEFEDRSLWVFMHRGDSRGDGGSNVYFLANKKKDYEPCSNLFEKLACRLKDKALIISDGSNSIRRLGRFHNDPTTDGRGAFLEYQKRGGFDYGGFRWTCVGWLSRGYGPTLVWGLTRQ